MGVYSGNIKNFGCLESFSNSFFGLYSSSFGMLMPGRHASAGDQYSYGFQGELIDDEIKGEGNSINYKYRMHDPRIGRFFAVDPLANRYPHNSPYAFSENDVIACVELEGLEKSLAEKGWASNMGTGKLIIFTDIKALGQAQLMAEITMVDFMFVEKLSDVNQFLDEYLSDNSLEGIDFLGFNGHGFDGVKVYVDAMDPVTNKIEKDYTYITPELLNNNNIMSDTKSIAKKEFVGMLSKISKEGTFVLLACLIDENFGEACLNLLEKNITIYTNSDVTTFAGSTMTYNGETYQWTQSVVGSPLTSENCYSKGWVVTNNEAGKQNVNNSISIGIEGEVTPVEQSGTSEICD